jgi:hypothetical protein
MVVMADLFQLDPQTLATVENGIDSLIHQLGKQCMLVFDGQPAVCNNCIFDPNTGRSSNVYNGVGPKPFGGGKCPVCHGTGFLPGTQTTQQPVQLLIDWQPKLWQFFNMNDTTLRIPQGLVHSKGFAADLPKVVQAKFVIIDYLNPSYNSSRYRLWGEASLTGNIVKSKYFIAFWERLGD